MLVPGRPDRVFDWWVSADRWDWDRHHLESRVKLEDAEETRDTAGRQISYTVRSRRCTATWVSETRWNGSELTISTVSHEEMLMQRGSRVLHIESKIDTSFHDGAELVETLVTYEFDRRYHGGWRRRDFLPGSVGQRRALARTGVKLLATEYEKSIPELK